MSVKAVAGKTGMINFRAPMWRGSRYFWPRTFDQQSLAQQWHGQALAAAMAGSLSTRAARQDRTAEKAPPRIQFASVQFTSWSAA